MNSSQDSSVDRNAYGDVRSDVDYYASRFQDSLRRERAVFDDLEKIWKQQKRGLEAEVKYWKNIAQGNKASPGLDRIESSRTSRDVTVKSEITTDINIDIGCNNGKFSESENGLDLGRGNYKDGELGNEHIRQYQVKIDKLQTRLAEIMDKRQEDKEIICKWRVELSKRKRENQILRGQIRMLQMKSPLADISNLPSVSGASVHFSGERDQNLNAKLPKQETPQPTSLQLPTPLSMLHVQRYDLNTPTKADCLKRTSQCLYAPDPYVQSDHQNDQNQQDKMNLDREKLENPSKRDITSQHPLELHRQDQTEDPIIQEINNLDPIKGLTHSSDLLSRLASHSWTIEDFIINPKFNQNQDHAFHETVRGNARSCLHGRECVSCQQFYSLANPTADERAGHSNSTDAGNNIIQAASKHKSQWQRPKSPIGFWRSDFPSTQEIYSEKEQTKLRNRERIDERLREALVNGRWLFRNPGFRP
ncbi:uncharacterized protein V1516DRAFT_693737 [Lipomyces oligophaga]|uniref:uncharacterized protein n=1 Tax=Lipomyces oligophaga TaxID=45792 RepID=UPI0034CFB9F7